MIELLSLLKLVHYEYEVKVKCQMTGHEIITKSSLFKQDVQMGYLTNPEVLYIEIEDDMLVIYTTEFYRRDYVEVIMVLNTVKDCKTVILGDNDKYLYKFDYDIDYNKDVRLYNMLCKKVVDIDREGDTLLITFVW